MSSVPLAAAAAQFHALDGAQRSPAKPASSTSTNDDIDMLASPLITGSRGAVPVSSPSMSKLPGLQYAISHRRTDLRLPSFTMAYDSSSSLDAPSPTSSAAESSTELSATPATTASTTASASALHLSPAHCETPHFLPGVAAFCPEASPTDKTPATATVLASAEDDDDELKRRKKGTRRGTLNPAAKNVLKAWMFSPEHFAHPYPSEEEKEELATEAGIEVKQLSNWFTNARKRLWQPVLRQSGVEVKNFLSTGRGGPRGNKLDVPVNLQQLVPPSPPVSPRTRSNSSAASSETSASPLKRTWSDMEASLPSDASASASASASTSASAVKSAPKRKKTATAVRKKSSASRNDDAAPAMATIAHQLSHELRLALAERAASSASSSPTAHDQPPTFQELEILAATSLIGLHQQQYQPVH